MARVKATDLIDYTRASNGTALAKVSYGSELVTNGTFDTDVSGWTVNASGSLSLSLNRLRITNVSGRGGAYTSFATEVGKVYSISLDVPDSNNPPSAFWVFSGTAPNTSGNFSVFNQPAGSHEYSFVASSTTTYLTIYVSNSSVASYTEFDNISVKEVTFDQPDGTLQLFNHPTNIPRIEYDADGNLLGLLIEESRTNLVTASALPPLLGATRDTVNNITSPTQELNGGLVVEDTSLNAHGIRQTSILPTAGAAEYTVSVFAKAKERSFLRMQMYGDAVAHTLEGWDLTAGTAPSGGTIQDCGNGWYRCSGTFTVANTTGGFNYASVYLGESSGSYYYTGDGSSGAYMFGFQVEAGAFSTSYIPTSGATATRAADVASIPVSEFGYNQNQGTVVAYYYAFAGQGGTARIASINDGTAANSIQSAVLTGGGTYHEVRTGGSAVVTTVIAGSITDNALSKTAVASRKDNHAGVTNGGTVGTDTSGAMPTGVTTLSIGSHHGGNNPLNGHIKSIRYFPLRLTNATLQELTR